MKILQINTRYIGGGGASYIANLLHTNFNNMEEYSSYFLYGRGQNGASLTKKIIYPYTEYLNALVYRVVGIDFCINKNLESFIIEADIIHLHNIHGYYIQYENLFKLLKKHNKKIVWTLHDMWPITGRCAYSFGCDKWKKCCGNCRSLSLYPKTFYDRSKKEIIKKRKIISSIHKENLIIVTPSIWLGDLCKETYLNQFKIISIPNGIEHEELVADYNDIRKKFNIDPTKKVILFAAADTKDIRKGIHYILDIIPKCQDFLFISFGEKISSIEYCNFIQLGYIKDRQTINEIYYMSDLFIIPSLDDNFPTTVLESFANGTPVIGFNQGGIPEQLADNAGIIVQENSSEELLKEINLLFSDPQRLKMLSENCKKKFHDSYTLSKFIKSYEKVYQNLGGIR